MSLLGNHNNNFEKRLKKQLGDTEFKPSESLWDNIDCEINKPGFEKQINSKLNQYEVKPSKHTWAQIEKQLPPEPNKWAFAYRLRLGLVLLLFSSGLVVGYWLKTQHEKPMLADNSTQKSNAAPQTETKITRSTNKSTSKAVTNNVTKAKQLQTDKPVATNEQVSEPLLLSKNSKKYHSTLAPFGASKQSQSKSTQPIAKVNVKGASISAQNNFTRSAKKNIVSNESIIPINSNVSESNTSQPTETKHIDVMPAIQTPLTESKTTTFADNTVLVDDDTIPPTQVKQVFADSAVTVASQNNLPKPKQEDKYTFAIRIVAGVHQSNMLLTNASNRDMSANINMRKQVEKPQVSVSTGFLVEFPISQKWQVASGVFISHFKMGMSYDVTPTATPILAEKGATYTNVNDSVTQGTYQNQTISYSWNEIPLLFTYKFKTYRKLSFETTVGLSYAIVNTVDAAMVGNNNVGVLVVKGKEAFPLIKNNVFAHLNIGACYQLNESVFITASPYFRHSITSMVATKNWVQQYPYFIGFNVGLRKQF